MHPKIMTRGLTAGSLFKILFIGQAFSLGLIIILLGILSYFGYETIMINGEHMVGVKGFLYSLGLAPLFTLTFSTVLWLFISIGLWLYTRFRPILLFYKIVD